MQHEVREGRKYASRWTLNTPLATFVSYFRFWLRPLAPDPAPSEGRACAVVFDCKFIETSATLQHNVTELFEGVVRQLRLRRRDLRAQGPPTPRRRASLGQRARRFLARLVARSARRQALKERSKSCHNLAVL